MLKKRIAMEQLNGATNVSANDPLEVGVQEEPASENGVLEKAEQESVKKRGRPAGKIAGRKSKRKSGIMKISRKKIKKPDPPSPDKEGKKEVDAIVGHKKEKGKTLYQVTWKGTRTSSWVPAADLSCNEKIKRYKKKLEKEKKDVYVVQKIIDHRRLKGTIYYRVRWENYSPKDDTWQAKESLNCNELLKEYHDDLNKTILEREEAKLLAKNEAKDGEYEVEAILDSKTIKGKTKFLIRWKGWEEADDTWEPEETLNCPELIRKFTKNKKTPSKKIKGTKRKHNSDSEDDNSEDSDYGGGKKGKGHISGSVYEVEKVLDARINRHGKWEFFVMWKGWGPEHNNWEPESNLNCPQLINQFLGKNKVPRSIQAKLEQTETLITTPQKAKRKPPSERGTPSVGGLRGRTKGALKVLT